MATTVTVELYKNEYYAKFERERKVDPTLCSIRPCHNGGVELRGPSHAMKEK